MKDCGNNDFQLPLYCKVFRDGIAQNILTAGKHSLETNFVAH